MIACLRNKDAFMGQELGHRHYKFLICCLFNHMLASKDVYEKSPEDIDAMNENEMKVLSKVEINEFLSVLQGMDDVADSNFDTSFHMIV